MIKKNVIIGCTSLGDNPLRKEILELVSSNHKKYCDQWNLSYDLVEHSFLQNACLVNGQHTDCDPYWNKIPILCRWLDQPHNFQDQEEWYIMIDDDVVITNMTIDPIKAIEALQKTLHTSIIVMKDPQLWNGDPETSVNTGIMIVRKDSFTRSLFQKVWEERNTPVENAPSYCPTLGVCKHQYKLYEQQGFANVLKTLSPLVIQQKIAILHPRSKCFIQTDMGSVEIALNTISRPRHFIQYSSSGPKLFDFDDPLEYQWKTGDWIGHATGTPLIGWFISPRDLKNCFWNTEALLNNSAWGKLEHEYIIDPPSPIRKNTITNMLEKIIHC